MTELTKRVVRRSREPFARNGKRLVIELCPGDLVRMRIERSRCNYEGRLADIFRTLALWHSDRVRAERKAARLARRAAL